MGAVFVIALWFAVPPAVARLAACAGRFPVRSPRYLHCWMLSAAGGAIGSQLPPSSWPTTAGCAASFLLALILWWLSRRRKRKALRALAGRAWARLAAMLKNMPKPGPVLRPVPQGSPS